jgi:flagellar hook-length control protein FliK
VPVLAVAAAATAAAQDPAAAMPRTDGDAGAAANAAIAGELRALHVPREAAIAPAGEDTAGREAAMRASAAGVAPADPAGATLALAQSLRNELPAAATVERTVHVPVRDPAWPQAVAAEIHFLADHKVEAATLRLSPEHLGPVEVRIDVRDGNVSVSFGVAHGDTQAALEQALPRLREMLAAAGLHLGQASVQQEARRGSHNGGTAPAAGEPASDGGDAVRARGVHGVGLVDEYV